HAAEDLLAAIQGGRLTATSEMINQALACLDQVSRWVDAFDMHASLPREAEEVARVLARGLRDHISKAQPAQAPRASSETPAGAPLPEWVSDLLRTEHEGISRHLQTHPSTLVAVSYEPRHGCFFDGDDPLALMRTIPNLLAFRAQPREAWPPLAE